MINVYDMSTGSLLSKDQDEEYSDEVLYSELQPIVKDFMELRLQLVETSTEKAERKAISDDLADIDCESFINSQDPK